MCRDDLAPETSAGSRARSGFLLTGGSGLVGRALAEEILGRGLPLVQAVRASDRAESAGPASPSRKSGVTELTWQPQAADPFPDPSAIESLDVAIHLSGANLAGHRWTPAYKREIVSSRTGSTTALAGALARLDRPPRLLIVASATGIYGDCGDRILTERSAPAEDFLGRTCQEWEAAAAPAAEAGIRVVHLRLGVVLAPHGGALAKMLPLFRLGLGGRLGNGRQWMSWIAIEDLVASVMHIAGYGAGRHNAVGSRTPTPVAAAGLLSGPVNCVSSEPVTNAAYTQALARALHRPAFATAPALALRLALGEMADAALLSSCRAVPEKLLADGFAFRFPQIGPALVHLLKQ